jgi:hypothetical protein
MAWLTAHLWMILSGLGLTGLAGAAVAFPQFSVPIWTWLCARSFWQLTTLGLGIFALFQHFELVSVRHEAAGWQKQYADLKSTYAAAQQKAQVEALAQKKATEAHYAALATEADEAHDQGFDEGLAAADAYIASHRLPAQPSGAGGATAAAASDHGPAVPEKLPSGSVIYSAADVQTCAADYEYALNAHNWALSLGASK